MHGSIGRDDSAGDTQPQLRPPTDLRGIPAACVSLTSHGAAGMGCLPRTAYDGPRGAARLSPGDERNTAITFDILQSAAPILPVRLIYIRVFLEVVLLNGKENELWQFP